LRTINLRLQDITNVLYQKLSIRGELGKVNWRGRDGVIKSLVDLAVVWHTSVSHGLDDSVKLQLSGDICLLLLGAVGGGNTILGWVVTGEGGKSVQYEYTRIGDRSRIRLTKSQSWLMVRETWFVITIISC
jgi:hypothetical protein